MGHHKKIFVSGSFNIIHPGHLRFLKFSRELGDELIVGVLSDEMGGESIHVPEKLRLEGVLANTWVSEALIINSPITEIILNLRPDIVVKGKEHELKANEEEAAVKAYGGKLVFSSGESGFSSLDLIRKSILNSNNQFLSFPRDYMERHRISLESLEKLVENFKKLKVCVIGDVIVDEYVTCEALGMSQEDPTIVVKPVDNIRFMGGAGIVAAHIANLGAEVDFISIVGCDQTGEWVANNLSGHGVNAFLFTDENRPTTLKQRYRAGNKTLLRVSHLHQESISINLQNQIIDRFEKKSLGYDILIFSDFNYGCLPQRCVERIIEISKSKKLPIAVDSQCSSQIGDVSRFKGVDLMLPTEHEVRISLMNQDDGLVVISEKLRKKCQAKNILVKLGEEGLLLHTLDDRGEIETDRLPAFNSKPVDVSGAGDSMLATAALVIASNGNIWEASLLASYAAATQVGRLGNTPICKDDILQFFS